MIKIKRIPLTLILLLIFSLLLFAGSESRIGTAGAQELLIPVGGQGIGLNGANVANIMGTEAIYWNPAGLAAGPRTEVMFSYMNWLADINLGYAAVGVKIGTSSALGFSFKSMGFGDIPVTTTEFPDGTGESYSPQYMILGATYSRAMTDRINFGATLKLVNESIRQMRATGFVFDFGVQYRDIMPGVDFGIALKSLGPNMSFDGEDIEHHEVVNGTEPGSLARPMKLVMQSFDMPVTFEIGLGYAHRITAEHALHVYGDFQNFNFGNDHYKTGLEYNFRDFFFLRAGYLMTQNNDDNIYGPTLGAGFQARMGNSVVCFDYTYRDVDYFNANQFFSIRLGF